MVSSSMKLTMQKIKNGLTTFWYEVWQIKCVCKCVFFSTHMFAGMPKTCWLSNLKRAPKQEDCKPCIELCTGGASLHVEPPFQFNVCGWWCVCTTVCGPQEVLLIPLGSVGQQDQDKRAYRASGTFLNVTTLNNPHPCDCVVWIGV